MKRLVPLLILLLFLGSAKGQTFNVMTYNLRFDNPGDGINAWGERRAWVVSQIRTADAGIIGIQEGLYRQVTYLDSALAGYLHIGVGRDDGKRKGEYSAIFYNNKRFRVIRSSTFWLSETPDRVSKGWDAALERICTWGLFEERKSHRRFWVFNTHFDHMGEQARLHSAELILAKIKALNTKGYPVLLTGDFNAEPGSPPITLLGNSLNEAKTADKSMTMMPEGTFNGFDTTKAATERIDFIFSGRKGITFQNYTVLRERRGGRFASDHYPVVAVVRLD